MNFSQSEISQALHLRQEESATYAQIAYQIGGTASGIRRAMLRATRKTRAAERESNGFISRLRRALGLVTS